MGHLLSHGRPRWRSSALMRTTPAESFGLWRALHLLARVRDEVSCGRLEQYVTRRPLMPNRVSMRSRSCCRAGVHKNALTTCGGHLAWQRTLTSEGELTPAEPRPHGAGRASLGSLRETLLPLSAASLPSAQPHALMGSARLAHTYVSSHQATFHHVATVLMDMDTSRYRTC